MDAVTFVDALPETARRATKWTDYATTWAVIPDVVDGGVEENDRLLVDWFTRRLPKGAPVWHMHEPFERLKRLAHGYERVCFGSSGEYAVVGDDRWHRRCEQLRERTLSGAVGLSQIAGAGRSPGSGTVPVWPGLVAPAGVYFAGLCRGFGVVPVARVRVAHVLRWAVRREDADGAARRRRPSRLAPRPCVSWWRRASVSAAKAAAHLTEGRKPVYGLCFGCGAVAWELLNGVSDYCLGCDPAAYRSEEDDPCAWCDCATDDECERDWTDDVPSSAPRSGAPSVSCSRTGHNQ